MNLVCKQCGYENESQRVYCHNCGAKLDRSVLPEEARKPEESPDAVRRRVRKFANPGRFTFTQLGKMISTAVLYGFLAAVIVSALLPPRDVPPPPRDVLDAPALAYEIEEAVAAKRPITITQNQLNAYLARVIRSKKSESWVKYERTYMRLRPGIVWTSMEFSIFNYPFHATTGHAPVMTEGHVVARNVGGYFGRLPIHPALMSFLGKPFGTLWDALKAERELLGKMREVRVAEGSITLVPGASPPRS